jgi:hypothetical protein
MNLIYLRPENEVACSEKTLVPTYQTHRISFTKFNHTKKH